MNPSHQTDLKELLLEVLSDTRLQTLIHIWRKLSSQQKRLLLRVTRGFSRT